MTRADRRFAPFLAGVMILLPALWAGLVVGISFVATPAKFSAASLTLPVALDVGQATFHLMARIEWVLAAALLLAAAFSGRGFWKTVAAAILAGLVLAQSLWLLPALDVRIEMVIAGVPTPSSSLHLLYILAECVKLVLLASLSAAVFGARERKFGK